MVVSSGYPNTAFIGRLPGLDGVADVHGDEVRCQIQLTERLALTDQCAARVQRPKTKLIVQAVHSRVAREYPRRRIVDALRARAAYNRGVLARVILAQTTHDEFEIGLALLE